MKKQPLLLIVLLLLLAAGGWYLSTKINSSEIQEEIEQSYLTPEGLVKNYPSGNKLEYLSESTGLYLHWLLLKEDEKRFAEQVKVLKKYFIIKSGEEWFIKWKTGDEITVNAFIDDARIIHTLYEAEDHFDEPAYGELGRKLAAPIIKHQVKPAGIAEFYDWSLERPAETMVYSYLDPDFLQVLDIASPGFASGSMFYPEKLSITKGKAISDKEAHMVDQLLIASYCDGTSCENNQLSQWLITEFKEEKAIYGRYDKETKQPTVPYESRAVYALLVQYLNGHNEDAAKKVMAQKEEFFSVEPTRDMHFFDYIHPLIVQREIE